MAITLMWFWRPRTIPEAMEWLGGRLVFLLNWCILRTKTSCWYGHVCLLLTDFTGGFYTHEVTVGVTCSPPNILCENIGNNDLATLKAYSLHQHGKCTIWASQKTESWEGSELTPSHWCETLRDAIALPFIKPKELPNRKVGSYFAPHLHRAVKELLQLISKTWRVFFSIG